MNRDNALYVGLDENKSCTVRLDEKPFTKSLHGWAPRTVRLDEKALCTMSLDENAQFVVSLDERCEPIGRGRVDTSCSVGQGKTTQ